MIIGCILSCIYYARGNNPSHPPNIQLKLFLPESAGNPVQSWNAQGATALALGVGAHSFRPRGQGQQTAALRPRLGGPLFLCGS